MSNLNKVLKPAFILLLFCLTTKITNANINAIDLPAANYPKALQPDIDFLTTNQSFYNHWAHFWNYKIPKAKVIERLSTLYTTLDNLPNKNTEANLLIGDIAHYLYNMEVDEYYKKAIDHYEAAKTLAPNDYRVYWFLANHYALSAKTIVAAQSYDQAMRYQPPVAHPSFWADYAVACALANMPATAMYAAEKSSSIVAEKHTSRPRPPAYSKKVYYARPQRNYDHGKRYVVRLWAKQ